MTGAPTDRRLTPANGRVAHVSLRGQVAAERFVPGEAMRITRPLADLRRAPGEGARDRQMLMGAGFLVLERRQDHAFGQAEQDGYVGWLDARALGPAVAPTDFIAAPASHLYTAPDIRAPEVSALSFGARLTITGQTGAFAQTDAGLFVPRAHLRGLDDTFDDPAGVADLLLGTPYLWGGNSRSGIDCSGLVQAAFVACGMACPADSDLQARWGREIPRSDPPERGDLLFWHGHVAMVVDRETLIHANAHHMAVVREPAAQAIARIMQQGGGPVIARRRATGGAG